MRYASSEASGLLTSTGTWSLMAVAICACCAAVAFYSRREQRRREKLLAARRRVGFRQRNQFFNWGEIGLERLSKESTSLSPPLQ